MNEKYYAFAVMSSKVVMDRTGRPTKRSVLLYDTRTFATAKECDAYYANWRQTHPLRLSTVVEFNKKPNIDPVTHELK
jgi:hypothetical protein